MKNESLLNSASGVFIIFLITIFIIVLMVTLFPNEVIGLVKWIKINIEGVPLENFY